MFAVLLDQSTSRPPTMDERYTASLADRLSPRSPRGWSGWPDKQALTSALLSVHSESARSMCSCEFGAACLYSSTHGAVAQLVERLLCK